MSTLPLKSQIQSQFNRFILENDVVGLFPEPRKLKSGRTSHWYVNWRNAATDAFLMDELTDHIRDFINSLDYKYTGTMTKTCIYGVPDGATGIGIVSTFKYAQGCSNHESGSHRLAIGRSQPKEHGDPKDRDFVGAPKGDVIIIEDVTTTGNSLLKTIDKVVNLPDARIIAAIGLTNRMERRDDGKSVREAVEATGVPYFQMSNGPELLKLMYAKKPFAPEIKHAIEEEFERYGVEKLKF